MDSFCNFRNLYFNFAEIAIHNAAGIISFLTPGIQGSPIHSSPATQLGVSSLHLPPSLVWRG